MLKIAVVDDEIVFVESLINKITAVCEKLNLKFKIDKYSNGFDILENYSIMIKQATVISFSFSMQ